MKSNVLRIIIFVLFTLFAVAAIAAVLILGRRIQTLKNDNEILGNRVIEQQKENADLNAKIIELQSTVDLLNGRLDEQEKLEEEAKAVIDINQLQPGEILLEEQINRDQLEQYFLINNIPDDIYQRINGKSYRENNDIGLDELRYLKLIHYNFDHQIQIGELIVNAALAQDFANIFRELFENEYEICSMYLVDNYWTGDGGTTDSASIDVNNTSAFNYRPVTGSATTLSNHAFGCAIDINPQQNPYVSYRSGSPSWSHENANDYIDRSTGYEHVITHDDLCYKIFTKYGFSWGGDWSTIKDYQHFEKEIY